MTENHAISMTHPMTHGQAIELETPLCPLCGGDDPRPFLSGRDLEFGGRDRFTVVACRRCGLRYLSPRPSPQDIGRFYPAAYYTHHSMEAGEAARLYRQALALVARWAPSGSLLDIGAGDGAFLDALRRHGRTELQGLEADPEAWRVATAGRRLDVALGRFPDVLPEGRRFQAIVMLETIEHLHRPQDALQAIHDRLAPGGRLVLSTPNIRGLEFRLLGARSISLQLPRHLSFYDRATLSAACRRAGLVVRSTATSPATDGLTRSLWLLARGILRRSGGDGNPAEASPGSAAPAAAQATYQARSWRRTVHRGLDLLLLPLGWLLAAIGLGPTLYLVAERPIEGGPS